jgi:hypothetical protein
MWPQTTPWQELRLRVHGKTHVQPRLTAFYALQPDMKYSYSGTCVFLVSGSVGGKLLLHSDDCRRAALSRDAHDVGTTLSPLPFTPKLRELLALVEKLAGGDATFNSAMLNLYRDGNHRVGWHADNETKCVHVAWFTTHRHVPVAHFQELLVLAAAKGGIMHTTPVLNQYPLCC